MIHEKPLTETLFKADCCHMLDTKTSKIKNVYLKVWIENIPRFLIRRFSDTA